MWRFRNGIFLICIGLTTLILTSYATSIDAQASESVPRYEAAECFFPIPAGEQVECGYLTVAENRQNPDSDKTIQIYVAHFKSHAENPPADPIVYLVGGPGVSLLYDIETIFYHFALYLENRDVIVIDQRGTGYSRPALRCDLRPQHQDPRACYRYLTRTLDADLSAYNSIENAADVEDLRRVFGYKEWNIIGTSYGARLALYLMREHPEGIRSVILDSTAPPHVQRDFDVRYVINDLQLQRLFADCAADPICNLAYPHLTATYETVLSDLRDNPLKIEFTDGDIHEIGDDEFRRILFDLMADTPTALTVPAVIEAAAQRDEDRITRARLPSEYTVFNGMLWAMNCNDGDNLFMRDICETWDIGNDEVPPAVQSDLPTLIVVGAYDTLTPPDWSDSAADALTNATLLIFPYTSHGVIRSEGTCPDQIAFAFLDNPTQPIDSSCIAEMRPRFVIESITVFN